MGQLQAIFRNVGRCLRSGNGTGGLTHLHQRISIADQAVDFPGKPTLIKSRGLDYDCASCMCQHLRIGRLMIRCSVGKWQ
jgi:hypothetical protein